jgi:hypothetical protein
VDLDAIFDQSKPSFPPLNPQALFVSFQVWFWFLQQNASFSLE